MKPKTATEQVRSALSVAQVMGEADGLRRAATIVTQAVLMGTGQADCDRALARIARRFVKESEACAGKVRSAVDQKTPTAEEE